MFDEKRLFVNFASISAIIIFAKGVSYLSRILAAETLELASFGVFVSITSFAAIACGLVVQGLGQLLIKETVRKAGQSIISLTPIKLLIFNLVIFFGFGLLYLGVSPANPATFQFGVGLPFLTAVIFISIIQTMMTQIYTANHQPIRGMLNLVAVPSVLFLVQLTFFEITTLHDVLLAYATSNFMAVISIGLLSYKKIRFHAPHGSLIHQLKYFYTVGIVTNVYVLQQNLDKLFLLYFTNSEVVGHFALVVLILSAPGMLITGVDSIMIPKLRQAITLGGERSILPVLSSLNGLLFYFGIISIAIAAILADVIVASILEVSTSLPLLLILAAAELIKMTAGITGKVMQIIGEETFELRLTIFSLSVFILCNVIFIPLMGSIGAAVSLLALRVVGLVGRFYRLNRTYGVNMVNINAIECCRIIKGLSK